MTESEFKDYLISLALEIEQGKASVAIVAVRGADLNIAAAGDDCIEAMAHLLAVAETQQKTWNSGVTLN